MRSASAGGTASNERQGMPVILTPHPGNGAPGRQENFRRAERAVLETARNCAARYRCHVVLKGFQTVVAAPTGETYINNTGNPGMATGGTGDILAGIMGRFVAAWRHQADLGNSADIADYVSAAVYLHGLSGDLAAEHEGMSL